MRKMQVTLRSNACTTRTYPEKLWVLHGEEQCSSSRDEGESSADESVFRGIPCDFIGAILGGQGRHDVGACSRAGEKLLVLS